MSESERRRRFGAYLAQLRRRAKKSQRALAVSLCAVSGTASITRNEVSRWERGERIPDTWLPFLAEALGAPLHELERAAAYARDEAGGFLPGPTATLAELLPGDPLAPLTTPRGRHIGAGNVSDLAARVHGLRLADDVLSGGDLIGPAFRELRAAVLLHQGAAFSDETGRALLVQIAELAQIAGWIASDAGRHADAERAYTMGISAARQGGDRTLAANLAGSLAYQHTNSGRQREGIDLAHAAVEEAGPDVPARPLALFLDRIAWAHAKAGEAQPAIRALGQAHAALADDDGTPSPAWAYWVTSEELDIMDARAFTELRRPLRAVPLLSDVLGRYDATHVREVALYRSWLAEALADANEPEQAAHEARRVIELSADLPSERTAERTRVVLHRLAEHEDVPEVHDLLTTHGHLALL
ncbi:helix-turn-helix transcriptional regulator [Actinacidiphila sp. ITFR-21]|uniref:helix-turn-helix transcriptional regulator n=1 Tax=Actinacidiphila sp. ITFR-21 TaxID=3075199 RepID=UPI00288B15FE|nr:helix-turn-helix transcriptional regulator [Streptomyces sp. ITFR-21]WNI17310.1 helix-turn-helix transcriptional regulator [Streptomyces sp. ITFR-21]